MKAIVGVMIVVLVMLGIVAGIVYSGDPLTCPYDDETFCEEVWPEALTQAACVPPEIEGVDTSTWCDEATPTMESVGPEDKPSPEATEVPYFNAGMFGHGKENPFTQPLYRFGR